LSQHAGDKQFKVKAGNRMPYFLVEDQSIYHKLSQPKFHLLIFSNTPSDFDALKTKLESWDTEFVDFMVIPLDPQVVEVFGMNRSFSVLLRPDNYIALISTETSLNQVKTYFKEHSFVTLASSIVGQACDGEVARGKDATASNGTA
jgi:hypothetical protein